VVQVVKLPELTAKKFYAGKRKKPGPKPSLLVKQLGVSPPAVKQARRSYTINYKLCVLSWLVWPFIPCGPTKLREATLAEAAKHFRIPAVTLGKWRKEEKSGNYDTENHQQ